MANKIVRFFDDSGDLVPVLAVDNGDGTFSISVDTEISVSGVSIGEVDQGSAGTEDWKVTLDGETVTVVSPPFSTATQITGQITVSTAGTAVQGPNIPLTNGVFVEALNSNIGNVYVGNDGAGDVTSSNGFELAAGKAVLVQVSNLNQLWFDAAVNGEKFCWMKA